MPSSVSSYIYSLDKVRAYLIRHGKRPQRGLLGPAKFGGNALNQGESGGAKAPGKTLGVENIASSYDEAVAPPTRAGLGLLLKGQEMSAKYNLTDREADFVRYEMYRTGDTLAWKGLAKTSPNWAEAVRKLPDESGLLVCAVEFQEIVSDAIKRVRKVMMIFEEQAND